MRKTKRRIGCAHIQAVRVLLIRAAITAARNAVRSTVLGKRRVLASTTFVARPRKPEKRLKSKKVYTAVSILKLRRKTRKNHC